MHSTQFTALAQHADEMGRVVIAMHMRDSNASGDAIGTVLLGYDPTSHGNYQHYSVHEFDMAARPTRSGYEVEFLNGQGYAQRARAMRAFKAEVR